MPYFAVKESHDEILALITRQARRYKAAIDNLIPTLIPRHPRATPNDHDTALERLHQVFWQTETLADLLARRRVYLEHDAAARAKGRNLAAYFASGANDIIPEIPFTEAIEDIARREPRLAEEVPGGQPTYLKVSELYRTGHSFAVARSTDLELTRSISEYLTRAINAGTPVPEAKDVLSAVLNWSHSYAETVFRTNVQTAYQAGRFRQVFDPDVAEILRAFEYDAVLDSDTRKNHRAAHGFLAATTDPRWHDVSPPMGYNCRCGTRVVDIWELRQRGLIEKSGRIKTLVPSGFGDATPDKGFGGRRPDILIYSGSLV